MGKLIIGRLLEQIEVEIKKFATLVLGCSHMIATLLGSIGLRCYVGPMYTRNLFVCVECIEIHAPK